ncbi:hypothetical protein PInf_002602 [Phytophthora infestans]|nr:hypothetical protein PInf_002602 [Phytophthora infestans]
MTDPLSARIKREDWSDFEDEDEVNPPVPAEDKHAPEEAFDKEEDEEEVEEASGDDDAGDYEDYDDDMESSSK